MKTKLPVTSCQLPQQTHAGRLLRQLATGNWQLATVAAALVIGCESTATTQPSATVQSRQDSALKDPFSYGPDAHDPKKSPQGLDPKHPGDGTAKSEWDRFWNP